MRRVTGVSLEGGKNVVVRGLGDRYTKIILNSVEIPGLDPDRNSVQMDIFPTNIIDNVVVYKTFSPNLPGDFSGGIVDIVTKDFPEKKTFGASISLGYNPNMHFKNNFLKYNSSSTDWLGFDDGTRALPFYKNIVLPDPSLKSPALESATKSFTKELASSESMNNLNKSISLSYGDQKTYSKGSLGYIFAINYNNTTNHYDNFRIGEFLKNSEGTGYELNRETAGTLSEQSVLWSALGGISFKSKKNKVSLDVLKIQNGESKSAKLTQANVELNSSVIQRDNLEYYERSITNISLSGRHNLAEKLTLNWRLSPTIVGVDEPDIRTTGFDITEAENPVLRPAVGADVTRIYRNLNENNLASNVDLSYDTKFLNRDSKFKFGIYANRKARDFEIYNFLFRVGNQSELALNGDPNNLLKDENIWSTIRPEGTYVIGNYEPANTFQATQNIFAAYAMNDQQITKKLKVIYGLRFEKITTNYSGQNNSGSIVYNNTKVFDANNFLPSLNAVYQIKEKLNLRASINRTAARPTFKENSIAQIQDRISDRTFLGNISLKQTKINNYDLRLEKFFTEGDLVSASLFMKQFFDPIQLAVFDASNPTNFIPRNFDDVNVYGFELEAVKKLGFISESLNNFQLAANFTMVESKFNLVGLSPTIFNTALNYTNKDNGFEASLNYNVQGPKLAIVGSGRISDVYELPFKALNFRIAKSFGIENRYQIALLGENLLNSKKQKQYEKLGSSQGAIFEYYEVGPLYTVTFSTKL